MTCEASTKCEFSCTAGNCASVICKADTCEQSCTGGGCGLECHGTTCAQSCNKGNCALQCSSQRQRRARKVVQLTKTGAPKSISIFLSLMMRLGVEFLCLADVFYGESWV